MSAQSSAAPQTGATMDSREREQLLRPIPKVTLKGLGIAAAIAIAFAWGMAGTNASPAMLLEGIPNIWNFLVRLFPLQWVMVNMDVGLFGSTWATFSVPEALPALIETLQMAIIGTALAVVLSLPFGLLAARNISPHPIVYQGIRLLLNMNRAVPDIIIALVFVAAVGLGPFSGVMALALGSIGTASKMYAESIESIDPAQVQAIRATGANGLQTFSFSVIPQALPLIASYSLLMFESNVRSASILGIVGAGGVGLILNKYMALFKYQELMGALLLIIIAVTIIDRFSDAIRRRII
jgi:phosphonate transport system permease protein